MNSVVAFTESLNAIVWGIPMIILILGIGLYLMIALRAMPLRRFGMGMKILFGKGPAAAEGEISPFNALMTAMAGTVGTGNIAGVATAIFLGGPGAIFWMWCTALVGMATKYTEVFCAVRFREVDHLGNYVGGPMYYIKNGLGQKWRWLAFAFALFGSVAAFGIGNTVQSNSVAHALEASFGVPSWVTGLVLMVLVGIVLLGGIRWIGQVAGVLVPFMAALYVCAGLVVLALNIGEVPAAIGLIFTAAFTPTAAAGGFAGAAVWAAMRFGVARGIFSNEAGLGTSPIAHAAARTNSPVRQGMIGMLDPFLDTIVVCSITALAIIVSGVWTSGETGAALTTMAFGATLGAIGSPIVAISLSIFAFTTLLGWSYYGERCVEYILGENAIKPFRVVWTLAVLLGALVDLGFVWLFADTLNAMMAFPNLIAIALLSPLVLRETRVFFKARSANDSATTV